MNKIVITGRVTKDIELKYTSNNNPVCEFSIAVNRIGQEQADFINCQAWNTQAENLTKYQGKGSLIGVEGSLRVDKFQDKEGKDRYKTYVLVSNIEYLGTKKEDVVRNGQNIARNEEADPFAEFGEDINIDDNWLD